MKFSAKFGVQNSRPPGGFTLIEIMVVVAIMGVMMAMGVPAIYNNLKQEGIRRAVNDVMTGCEKARALAIMSGAKAELHFHPKDGRLEIGLVGGQEGAGDTNAPANPAPAGGIFSAQLPANVSLEMLDVNLGEFKDAEDAHVMFFPNGRSDEMTVVLRSPRNELKKITLEITTGLATLSNL